MSAATPSTPVSATEPGSYIFAVGSGAEIPCMCLRTSLSMEGSLKDAGYLLVIGTSPLIAPNAFSGTIISNRRGESFVIERQVAGRIMTKAKNNNSLWNHIVTVLLRNLNCTFNREIIFDLTVNC